MLKSQFARILWLTALLLCAAMAFHELKIYRGGVKDPYVPGQDGNYYFAWAHSIAIDGDLDFRNEYEFLASWPHNTGTKRYFQSILELPPTSKGLVRNRLGIGMAIVTLPAMVATREVGHLYTAITGIPIHPFAPIYILVFDLVSMMAGFAGLALTYRMIQSLFGNRVALFSTIAGASLLPTGQYIWYDYTMAHSLTFALGALFFKFTMKWYDGIDSGSSADRINLSAFVAGLVLGLACATRVAAIALAPAMPAVGILLLCKSTSRSQSAKRLVTSAVVVALGFIIGFAPQMIAWKTLYGSFFHNSYEATLDEGTMGLWPRHLLHVLFSLNNGLFTNTPLALLGAIGLVYGCFMRRAWAFAGLAMFAATAWIYGSWSRVDLGVTYGMRGFVDSSVALILGSAAVFAWLSSKFSASIRRYYPAAVVLLVIWSAHLIFAYRSWRVEPRENFSWVRP